MKPSFHGDIYILYCPINRTSTDFKTLLFQQIAAYIPQVNVKYDPAN